MLLIIQGYENFNNYDGELEVQKVYDLPIPNNTNIQLEFTKWQHKFFEEIGVPVEWEVFHDKQNYVHESTRFLEKVTLKKVKEWKKIKDYENIFLFIEETYGVKPLEFVTYKK